MESLLERAKRSADEAEVFSTLRRETQAYFEANRLKQVQTRESEGVALRLIKDGRLGFSASTKPGREEILARALEVVPFGEEAKFHFPELGSYPAVETYDAEVEKIPEEKLAELGQELIDRLREHEPELVCEGAVTKATLKVRILNSRGGEACYHKSFFSLSLEGVLVRGTDMLFVGDRESSCSPILDPGGLLQTTLKQLEWARRVVPAPAGRVPVIFTPHGVASALITPLALAFSGKMVLRQASPLSGKMGKQVFDPQFSLWDDSTLPFRPASRSFDDEGVPSRRIPLVEGGVVQNFLYDLQTAALAGTESTGSASRTLSSLPSPSTTALIISEGKTDLKEMLKDIKQGLVVESLIGAEQGNVLGGEFSGNVLLGYRVENGEIIGRVKDTMVSGNIYEALKEVVLGRESRWVGSGLLAPPIYIPAIAVASKG